MTAVALADAGRAVTVVTKGALGDGSTAWAQGGLAAVLGADDDAELHVQDTLVAGAGLCDEAAVRTLVEEAPAAIAALQELGARLDLDADGRPALTREGGHSRDRIVHAGGDASGAEVTRTLAGALRARGIEVLEHTVALDALRAADGRVVGLRVARIGDDGALVDAGDLRARAIVLATGGYGQVFAATSNPGRRHRRRAGAGPAGRRRGRRRRDGAVPPDRALDRPGRRGPAGADLRGGARRGRRARRPRRTPDHGRRPPAGRPRPARRRLGHHRRPPAARPASDHVLLDATAPRRRLPRAAASPASSGPAARPAYDLTREPVPVAPAAHYSCGGVVADLDGRTERRRAVRRRRGRLHRRAGRQPAGVQLDHRGPRRRPPLRRPARRRPARRAPSRCPAGAGGGDRPGRPDDDHRGDHPGRRRAARRRRARRGWPASWPPSPGCRPARWTWPPSRPPPCTPSPPCSPPRPLARTESRGCHRRVRRPRDRDPSGRSAWCTGSTTPAGCTPAPSPSALAGRGMTGSTLGAVHREHAAALSAAGLDPAEVERGRPPGAGGGPRLRSRRHDGLHRARRAQATGDVVPRSPGVLAGIPVAAAVFDLVGGAEVEVDLLAADGTAARPGEAVLTVAGPARALLTAERTALNLIGHLSGIATLTRHWVDAVAGTGAAIRDTRKTTPGPAGAGEVRRALRRRRQPPDGARRRGPDQGQPRRRGRRHHRRRSRRSGRTRPAIPLEVECDTLDQVREALAAGVQLVLLDNFALDDTVAAVELARGTRLPAGGQRRADARPRPRGRGDRRRLPRRRRAHPQRPGARPGLRPPRLTRPDCSARASGSADPGSARNTPAGRSGACAGPGAPSRWPARRAARCSPAAARCSRRPACSAR